MMCDFLGSLVLRSNLSRPTMTRSCEFWCRNGIQQRRNSWQDGVYGTNCPIPPGKNFTYVLQVKDQIGSYFYFPSLAFHKAAGGFGGFKILSRSVIPVPFPPPAGDFTILAGDWFKQNHTVSTKFVTDNGQFPCSNFLVMLIPEHMRGFYWNSTGFESDFGWREWCSFPWWTSHQWSRTKWIHIYGWSRWLIASHITHQNAYWIRFSVRFFTPNFWFQILEYLNEFSPIFYIKRISFKPQNVHMHIFRI